MSKIDNKVKVEEEIRGFKLISGIDIIAKLVEYTENTTILSDALIVQIVQTQQGMGVTMMPIDMFSIDAEKSIGTNLELPNNSVLFGPYIPHSDLISRYEQEISPIDLSAKSKIIV